MSFKPERGYLIPFKLSWVLELEANYYAGGRQVIGGNPYSDVQRNSRVGGTVVFRFARRHAIKIGFSRGWVTDFGNDFDQFIVSHNVVFR